MKNIKWLLATVFVALFVYGNTARADTHEAKKPNKVEAFIQNEIEKTKAYQAKSWADAKAQWQKLLSKFQAK